MNEDQSSNDRLEELFEKALSLNSPKQRIEFIQRECPNPHLRRELESLLENHDRPHQVFQWDTTRVADCDPSGSISHLQYVGHILDEKYRLEQLLGEGGMGAVYLATHLGTGRFVALKLITPHLMRNPEFLERFKREAQAAGRLRHPNIVDVTDFGIARGSNQNIAYLVMEYLDGCTLSEVLAEETRLPLSWVADIVEQVCSAVHEAHLQGIIHRDLKPANIWLEPNTLGGYRVKVLDFGIAKLAESSPDPSRPILDQPATTSSTRFNPPATRSQTSPPSAPAKIDWVTPSSSASIPSNNEISDRTAQSQPHLATSSTSALTRVGAILGTPWYMSPEQCRSQDLDARSDIYSIGVIVYQMLCGATPFTGESTTVLRAHQDSHPIPLTKISRSVPKPISDLVMSALEKSPASRPQSAMAFAHALRAHTEQVGALYRRAFALYCEYFPTVIRLSLLAHIPVIIVTMLAMAIALFKPHLGILGPDHLEVPLGFLKGVASFVAGSTIAGIIAIIVTQLAVAPLRPVNLQSGFAILQQRWRPFLNTGIRATLRIVIGFILLVVPGMIMMVRYSLWAPVVLMEGLEKKPALARSKALASRSWKTSIFAMLFQVLSPVVAQALVSRLLGLRQGSGHTISTKVISELATLTSIFLMPLVSIVLSLVYLKMRQLGGEALVQVMANLEEVNTKKKWEHRMRRRISRPTT